MEPHCWLLFRKLTENKFRVGVERAELVEDWDQREVSSTLTRQQAGTYECLTLTGEPVTRPVTLTVQCEY